jgi:hypothetical protein
MSLFVHRSASDWEQMIGARDEERTPRAAYAGWRRRGECPTPAHAPSHPRTPQEIRAVFRKRGQQRRSALVSARTSRIARAMREHLGKARWRSFVAYAEAHYKEQFVSAFEPDSGVIACAGPIEGGPCPRVFVALIDDPGHSSCCSRCTSTTRTTSANCAPCGALRFRRAPADGAPESTARARARCSSA